MRGSSDKPTLWPHRARPTRLDRSFRVHGEPCRFFACLASTQIKLYLAKGPQHEVQSRITSHLHLCDCSRPICVPVGRHIAGYNKSTDQKHCPGARRVGRRIKLVKADPASSVKGLARRLRPKPADLFCRRRGETKRIIDAQDGPVLLVGHSYGGAVITEAGNNPKVAGLVYVAAFAPDQGESA